MDSKPTPQATAAVEDGLAAARHLYRNQIQAMTSLVGLFGRRLPPGEGREAFVDLRARFEAATFAPYEEMTPDAEGRYEVDLAEVVRRVASHLDPDIRHRFNIKAAPILAGAKRISALAQILAELVIEMIRNGFAGGQGSADVEILQARDGGVTIRLAQTGPAGTAPRRDSSDLGLAIADGLVRSLGGTVSRVAEGPLRTEVSAPPEHRRR